MPVKRIARRCRQNVYMGTEGNKKRRDMNGSCPVLIRQQGIVCYPGNASVPAGIFGSAIPGEGRLGGTSEASRDAGVPRLSQPYSLIALGFAAGEGLCFGDGLGG